MPFEQFDNNENQVIREYVFTFSGGDTQTLRLAGEFIAVKEATSDISVAFNGDQQISLAEGEVISRRRYSFIEISSASAQTIKVVAGNGTYTPNRVTTSVTVNATVENSNTFANVTRVSVGAGLTAVVLAADSARKEARISLLQSAASHVFFGGASVGATDGNPLHPGQADYLATTAAISVYNPHTAAIDVYVGSLKRV